MEKIKIDYPKTISEILEKFWEEVFSTFRPTKKLFGSLEGLRKYLLKEEKDISLGNNGKTRRVTLQALAVLNRCKLDYSDMKMSEEILGLASDFLLIIQENLKDKSNPNHRYFEKLYSQFNQIFKQFHFRLNKKSRESQRHLLKILADWQKVVLAKAKDIQIIIKELKKIKHKNHFSPLYLVWCKKKIQELLRGYPSLP